MIIAITGTPGCGKSWLAKQAAQMLDYDLISINDVVKDNKLILYHDMKRHSDVVDIDRLAGYKVRDNTVVEGHLSHYIRADVVVVLRCEPKELFSRLKERGWGKQKIRENLEAECMGLITSEALSKNRNVYEIDTSKRDVMASLNAIKQIIGGERNKYKPKIDYLEKITELDDLVKSVRS